MLDFFFLKRAFAHFLPWINISNTPSQIQGESLSILMERNCDHIRVQAGPNQI